MGTALRTSLLPVVPEQIRRLGCGVFDDEERSLAVARHWGLEIEEHSIDSSLDLTDPAALVEPTLPAGVTIDEVPDLAFADRDAVAHMLAVSQTNPEAAVGLRHDARRLCGHARRRRAAGLRRGSGRRRAGRHHVRRRAVADPAHRLQRRRPPLPRQGADAPRQAAGRTGSLPTSAPRCPARTTRSTTPASAASTPSSATSCAAASTEWSRTAPRSDPPPPLEWPRRHTGHRARRVTGEVPRPLEGAGAVEWPRRHTGHRARRVTGEVARPLEGAARGRVAVVVTRATACPSCDG